ncbi:hypothetical protein FLP10_09425 [Agromyces intestinalis]|uniref:DUF3137 domain-containing protein n=1 Tax=Agromyces intestinalis TaxID=2592652 RepID=A0A5C1YEZ0_9MICO|nr:hypothetical protein [Agromyces intestinalis]QEO14614.1 hypothetical protein FLP10_09425 [Agromyces intestinalis]
MTLPPPGQPHGAPTPPATVPFDTRPLTEPVDPAQIAASTRSLSGSGGTSSSTAKFAVVIISVAAGLLLLSMVVSAVVGILAGRSGGGLPQAMQLLIIALIGLGALVVARKRAAARAERRFRLDRFARANGMTYQPTFAAPGLPGMIFGLGRGRQATDQVRGYQPRFVEFANYEYTTGSGKNKTVHTWGYVAIKLNVPLPHIVLDAVGNNGLFGSNLPMAFDRAQRLSLEGDFDRYFALYCPEGYERDALYLFTPDIMARLIDNAAELDVEIVDDWMFLYAKRDFSTLDPATWAWLFSVVGALLDKFTRWERWRDDRLSVTASGAAVGRTASPLPFVAPIDSLRPPPGVAAPGRRLARGIRWAPIIIVGVILLPWLMQFVGGFFAVLLR